MLFRIDLWREEGLSPNTLFYEGQHDFYVLSLVKIMYNGAMTFN